MWDTDLLNKKITLDETEYDIHKSTIFDDDGNIKPFPNERIIQIENRKKEIHIGDIFVHKKYKSMIQIDSFACHINYAKDILIVYRHIEKSNCDMSVGISIPAFNGYGSEKEILEQYELLVPVEKLEDYNWEDIFNMVD